jgi:hypothetical protein
MQNIYDNHRDIGLFNNGDYLVFSFKKTEKIVSAIYLVTSLIKDNEPMKWELREGSMSLLSVTMSLNGAEHVDKNRLLQSFFTLSIQMISFLNISFVSGIISRMNSSLIIEEINSLVDYVKQQTILSSNSSGFILSDSFFATDVPVSKIDKGQSTYSKTASTQEAFNNKGAIVKDKKDTRKNSILSILKKDSQLTIKDFVKVITDCSEKTIQRELIELVEKGLVKKNGERRWSTYSLA